MGHAESKTWPIPPSPPSTPSNSPKRSSRRKSAKLDQIEGIAQSAKFVKDEIIAFKGRRASTGYIQFQKFLANSANQIQDIKKKRKSAYEIGRCNEILDDINDCYQKLEQKVAANDGGESSLDLAAVESNSFINVNNEKSPKRKRAKREYLASLEQLERKALALELETKRALDEDNFKKYAALKQDIEQLLVKSEMIQVDPHGPLHDQKQALTKKLIRYHRQMQKSNKKSANGKDERDSRRDSYQQLDDLISTEEALEDLEVRVSQFSGVRGDAAYKQLEQLLESHWTKLYSLDVMGDEDKNRKADDNEKVKRILQNLRRKGDENESERRAVEEMKSIETQLQGLKVAVANVSNKKRDGYLQVDQSLRELWASLSHVYEATEKTKKQKIHLIAEIQGQLRKLSEGSEDKNTQSHLIKQAEEFKSHLDQLIHSFEVQKFTSRDTLKETLQILEAASEKIQKKLVELQEAEKKFDDTDNLLQKLQNVVLRKQFPRDPILTPEQRSEEVRKRLSQIETAQFEVTKEINAFHKIVARAKELQSNIIASSCLKDDNLYKTFKTKLLELQQALGNMPYTRNTDSIGHSRKKASEAIAAALKHLEEKPTKFSETFQKVMDIDAGVQYLYQQIKAFTGTSKDTQYTKIESELIGHRNKLNQIEANTDEIPIRELENKIIQYQQELAAQLSENQGKTTRSSSYEIKKIVEVAQEVKQQIDRFTGTYKGIHYKSIEDKLKTCLSSLSDIDVSTDPKLSYAKQQLNQKINNYYKILEDRSTKPEGTNKLPHVQINSLRDKLVVIKNDTETFTGCYKDARYKKIEQALKNCSEELKLIEDCGHQSVRISKEQYDDYIVKLLKYFEEKTIAMQPEESIRDPMEELDVIEQTYKELKKRIVDFEGVYDDENYIEIEDLLVKIMVRIDGVNPGNVAQVRGRRKTLMQDVQNYAKEFEEKTKQETNEITKVLQELSDIYKKICVFEGNRSDAVYVQLDEALISLMVKLDGIGGGSNKKLEIQKEKAVREVQRHMKMLEERVKRNSALYS